MQAKQQLLHCIAKHLISVKCHGDTCKDMGYLAFGSICNINKVS